MMNGKSTHLRAVSRIPASLASLQAPSASAALRQDSPRQDSPRPAVLRRDETTGEPLPQMHLLIVDDDAPVRHACAEIAGSLGFVTLVADSVPTARSVLSRSPIDLVLLDLKLPGGGGLALLEEIRARTPETIVVVMTAYATVNSAVEAMRIGAGDYLTKPFSLDELSIVLERAAQRRAFDAESRNLRERLRSGKGMGSLIGNSPAMEKLYRILSKVAVTNHPVLILGEPGAGKELVARTIHGNGPSADKPFVPADCGSLLPALLESELFGYAKGYAVPHPGKSGERAADRSKPGLLAAAHGGTVYLDEVAELSPELQTKLLRALQEREVRPLGATHSVPITTRILAATSRDLEAMVATGRFRKDLFFRLSVVSLRIPPLRERKADIPLLAAHVLDRMRRDNGLAYTFADDTLRLLTEYEWPGNVRELTHAIERACALSSGPVLHTGDFPTQLQNFQAVVQRLREEQMEQMRSREAAFDQHFASAATQANSVLSIAELQKQAILNTIRELKGDKLMAARLLGIGKTTLYRKLKEYGVGDNQLLS
jgi:two-component system response regulator HydG